MGTLDDAIRQHLDLKRQSGAADDEVDRLATEALGPVRREAAPSAEAPAVEPPPAEPPLAAEPPPAPFGPPADGPEIPAAAASAPPPPPPPAAADLWLEDEPDDVAPPPPQRTSEFTATEVREAGAAPSSDYVAPDEEGEDLLEETPDFLQETPEHERLWFEQKPPRDFDFDQ